MNLEYMCELDNPFIPKIQHFFEIAFWLEHWGLAILKLQACLETPVPIKYPLYLSGAIYQPFNMAHLLVGVLFVQCRKITIAIATGK